MRWDSPMVLVIAGTIAIHTILIVFVDAMIVTHPLILKPPAPRIEMVEVDVAKPEPPKPPEPPPPEPEPVPQPEPQPQPRVAQPQPQLRARPAPTTTETPPPPDPNPAPPGGDPPTIPLAELPPGGKGIAVPVARGVRGTGRGGSGGGTGTGVGSGSGDPPPPPPPVSVATIKTRALPKGDYGYIDAGKDYPAEARQLGIEGAIRVKLVVDAGGKVQSAVLLNRLGHGLDELALQRARAIEFDPARDTDDKPVTSVVIWTFNMTLPK